jgi:hypothetical protein
MPIRHRQIAAGAETILDVDQQQRFHGYPSISIALQRCQALRVGSSLLCST